jgi:hypothetical protein
MQKFSLCVNQLTNGFVLDTLSPLVVHVDYLELYLIL